jgi:hypothetical protein
VGCPCCLNHFFPVHCPCQRLGNAITLNAGSNNLERRNPNHSLPQQQMAPTKTVPAGPAGVLFTRQSTVTVTAAPAGDNTSSGSQLSGGAIAGIVVGSIIGFLLLLWIIRSCFNLGAPPGQQRDAWYNDLPRRHSHSLRYSQHSSRSRSRRRRSSTRPVVIEEKTTRNLRRPDDVLVHDSRRGSRGRGYYTSY